MYITERKLCPYRTPYVLCVCGVFVDFVLSVDFFLFVWWLFDLLPVFFLFSIHYQAKIFRPVCVFSVVSFFAIIYCISLLIICVCCKDIHILRQGQIILLHRNEQSFIDFNSVYYKYLLCTINSVKSVFLIKVAKKYFFKKVHFFLFFYINF